MNVPSAFKARLAAVSICRRNRSVCRYQPIAARATSRATRTNPKRPESAQSARRRKFVIVLGNASATTAQSNAMLELRDVSLGAGRTPDERWLLRSINGRFAEGNLHAVVGPSGCGKSTLLKVIAGIRQPNEGTVHWRERDLNEHDLAPHEIGYVPQFSIAFELLTVEESVDTALRLRIGDLTDENRSARKDRFLAEVGLTEISGQRVSTLSGGQKRRLALALEMVSNPLLFLCDEVTSGLDPKSENEIVHLLHKISTTEQRTVISVTHSLRHLDLYDSVTVLYEGRL